MSSPKARELPFECRFDHRWVVELSGKLFLMTEARDGVVNKTSSYCIQLFTSPYG